MVMDWKRVGNYDMMLMFREDWGGEGGKGVRGGKRDGKGWWNGGMNKRIVCKEIELCIQDVPAAEPKSVSSPLRIWNRFPTATSIVSNAPAAE